MSARERIAALVRDCPGVRPSELSCVLEVDDAAVRRHLALLVDDGLLFARDHERYYVVKQFEEVQNG